MPARKNLPTEEKDRRNKARFALSLAVRNGVIKRARRCQTCGHTGLTEATRQNPIVGHHWNGYNQPLDVLWCCRSCNAIMIDDKFHKGLFTLDEIIEYIGKFLRDNNYDRQSLLWPTKARCLTEPEFDALNADKVRKVWERAHNATTNEVLSLVSDFLEDVGTGEPVDYEPKSVAGMLFFLVNRHLGK